jgi:hypothetical protein
MSENTVIIKKNTDTPLDASKEAGIEINAEKCMFMSHPQTTGQNVKDGAQGCDGFLSTSNVEYITSSQSILYKGT